MLLLSMSLSWELPHLPAWDTTSAFLGTRATTQRIPGAQRMGNFRTTEATGGRNVICVPDKDVVCTGAERRLMFEGCISTWQKATQRDGCGKDSHTTAM